MLATYDARGNPASVTDSTHRLGNIVFAYDGSLAILHQVDFSRESYNVDALVNCQRVLERK